MNSPPTSLCLHCAGITRVNHLLFFFHVLNIYSVYLYPYTYVSMHVEVRGQLAGVGSLHHIGPQVRQWLLGFVAGAFTHPATSPAPSCFFETGSFIWSGSHQVAYPDWPAAPRDPPNCSPSAPQCWNSKGVPPCPAFSCSTQKMLRESCQRLLISSGVAWSNENRGTYRPGLNSWAAQRQLGRAGRCQGPATSG